MEQEHFEALYPEGARSEEIQRIMGYIKEGSSCELLGIPGVSRSTILGLLAYNKKIRARYLGERQDEFHFIMVNFSEIRKRPMVDSIKFLFLTLSSSLRERGRIDEYRMVSGMFKESLSFGDELVLLQGLKEAISYLALERKFNLVFLFDRFEDFIPSLTGEFFTNLRTLRNTAKYHFSVVFSLNRPLESVLEPSILADYYEFVAGNLVYAGLYDEASTIFRLSYIEKITGKKIKKEIVADILRLTGGHSKLTKLATEAVLANPGTKDDLMPLLLSQIPVKGALLEIWISLSPAEQSDIRTGEFEDKELLAHLEKAGLVKDRQVQIPLLSEFIRSEGTSIRKGDIVYDENTNTIRKGEQVFSDQLTSSEFRLLRYLIQNHERVIEREEVINVVWEGVKSTAGITDQAVDQLIFRLRRKIEEDPNSPRHLLTIKGRGFKFEE